MCSNNIYTFLYDLSFAPPFPQIKVATYHFVKNQKRYTIEYTQYITYCHCCQRIIQIRDLTSRILYAGCIQIYYVNLFIHFHFLLHILQYAKSLGIQEINIAIDFLYILS